MLPARPCLPRKGGSFEQLRCALREWRPHIFWFAGHGDAALSDGERTLGFSGPDGALELLDPVVLANELRAHLPLSGGNLECAVLNACCTGGAAGRAGGWLGSLGDLLPQCGMPAVLCWRSRVHNEASAHFARGFGAGLTLTRTPHPNSNPNPRPHPSPNPNPNQARPSCAATPTRPHSRRPSSKSNPNPNPSPNPNPNPNPNPIPNPSS